MWVTITSCLFRASTHHLKTLTLSIPKPACSGTCGFCAACCCRAVHTNLHTRFSVDTLKLAMIKTEWLAKKLFGGKLYDCVCIFEEGIKQRGRQQ